MRKVLVFILALNAASVASAQTYTISPTPFQVALDNSGKIINNACVWTYTAGTTTVATTYSDNAGTPNTNPIRSDSAGRFTAFLSPGNSYKYVYESACVPPAHGTTLRTADNISAMPPSGVNVDITGTAGETINAGSAAYLSDGSGSTVAGQWYNADADFAYASTSPEIGFATTAVTSGNSASFRIQGRLTGLTSLSVGGTYYVSATAGAITSTVPASLPRFVGVADSTTSLIVTPNPPKVLATLPGALIAEGRLTASTGTPVTTADVSAATSIFYTPYTGNRIALYDSTASLWNTRTFTELTISLSGCTASKPYDVFLYDNAGTVASETLVWTNTTTRATALAQQDGAYVKSGTPSRRYVGSFFCNATGGQTDSTFVKQYIWNMYNRRARAMRRLEASSTWTYNSATWRQANAAAANQLEVMVGLAEDAMPVTVTAMVQTNTANDYAAVAVGVDSTSAIGTGTLWVSTRMPSGAADVPVMADLTTYPALGYHFLVWLESRPGGTGTLTFTGTASNGQSGISARWSD